MTTQDEGGQNTLYTVMFEFLGGSYISQVVASSHSDAQRKWALLLEPKTVRGMGQRMKQRLVKYCDEEELTAVNTVTHVWTFCFLICGRFGCVYIVETSTL